MSAFYDVNFNIYGNRKLDSLLAGPENAIGNQQEVACYGLNPKLEGTYSGIHNDDNITAKDIQAFAKKAGHVDIELKFINLEGGWVFPWQETSLVTNQDKAIFIKLEPYNPSADRIFNKHFLTKIINGEYDNIIRQFALRAKEAGVPILVSFGPEMNGYDKVKGFWYPWGGDPVTGKAAKGKNVEEIEANNAEKYITAYRHVFGVLHQEGARNIYKVWNPHVIRKEERDFTQYYPGDEYVDIIAFDIYSKRNDRSKLVDYMQQSIDTMDTFLGHQNATYAIGEWGANNKDQFEEMLTYLESEKRIKFNVYYNVNILTGDNKANYKMNNGMLTRYRQYLKKLATDKYSFNPVNYPTNPDITDDTCFLPVIPDPRQTLRYIPVEEFLTSEELEQKTCPDKPQCLLPFEPEWTPFNNIPPRTLSCEQLYPVEHKSVDRSIGHVYDYGTHQYLLNANKIQEQIESGDINLDVLADILRTLSTQNNLQPLDVHNLFQKRFYKKHPELKTIQNKYPDFATYLNQPKHFWENAIVLYSIYAQKVIESNNQEDIEELVSIGELFVQQAEVQKTFEGRTLARESFTPSKYHLANLSLSLAEVYAQLRDAPIKEYERGLTLANDSNAGFRTLGKYSGLDYFSMSKGILVAADLHAKIAQQHLLQTNYDLAEAEYLVAKALYDQLANLDYSIGTGLNVTAFRVQIGDEIIQSNLELTATPQQIIDSLEKNVSLKYINQAEAIASSHGLFQFLHGIALIKQAGFYMEFPFKPAEQKGYEDIVQNMVLVQSGLREIKNGSPFADQRYFKAWGNLLMAKLLISFADNVAYATSELPEEEATGIYLDATYLLEENLPNLFSIEEWKYLETIPCLGNFQDDNAVYKAMDDLALVSGDLTPDYILLSHELFKQTYNSYNYRVEFMDEFFKLSNAHLETANYQLYSPNRHDINDHLINQTPILEAELILQKVNLAIRQSDYIAFKDRDLLYGEISVDNQRIEELLAQIEYADTELGLPETSYLKIELALAKASLTLSLEGPVLKTSKDQEAFRKETYEVIDLLKDSNLNSDNKNNFYKTIVELESIREMVLKQPEPNRTLLLNQLNLKLSLAHLGLAANIINSYPKKGHFNNMLDKHRRNPKNPKYKKYNAINNKYVLSVTSKSKEILCGLELEINNNVYHSCSPLLYNIHDTRTELCHQLAIVFAMTAISEDAKPLMQHYLHLAKEENITSNSPFNVYYRSWLLNRFAIPKPSGTKQDRGDIRKGRRTLDWYNDVID